MLRSCGTACRRGGATLLQTPQLRIPWWIDRPAASSRTAPARSLPNASPPKGKNRANRTAQSQVAVASLETEGSQNRLTAARGPHCRQISRIGERLLQKRIRVALNPG